MRRGLGRGSGKGYMNLISHDPIVHSMSAKGIKQRQDLSITPIPDIKISTYTLRNYNINPNNLLESKNKYDGTPIMRFMYHPETKDFIGSGFEAHSLMLKRHDDKANFDEWVRGIYVSDSKKLYMRHYWQPKTCYDEFSVDDFNRSMDKQEQTVRMLKRHGLGEDVEIIYNVDNNLLRVMEGGYRW